MTNKQLLARLNKQEEVIANLMKDLGNLDIDLLRLIKEIEG